MRLHVPTGSGPLTLGLLTAPMLIQALVVRMTPDAVQYVTVTEFVVVPPGQQSVAIPKTGQSGVVFTEYLGVSAIDQAQHYSSINGPTSQSVSGSSSAGHSSPANPAGSATSLAAPAAASSSISGTISASASAATPSAAVTSSPAITPSAAAISLTSNASATPSVSSNSISPASNPASSGISPASASYSQGHPASITPVSAPSLGGTISASPSHTPASDEIVMFTYTDSDGLVYVKPTPLSALGGASAMAAASGTASVSESALSSGSASSISPVDPLAPPPRTPPTGSHATSIIAASTVNPSGTANLGSAVGSASSGAPPVSSNGSPVSASGQSGATSTAGSSTASSIPPGSSAGPDDATILSGNSVSGSGSSAVAAASASASASASAGAAASATPIAIAGPAITMDLGLSPEMVFKAPDMAALGLTASLNSRAHFTLDQAHKTVPFSIQWAEAQTQTAGVGQLLLVHEQQCQVYSPTTTPVFTSQTHNIFLSGGRQTGSPAWIPGPTNSPTLHWSCASPIISTVGQPVSASPGSSAAGPANSASASSAGTGTSAASPAAGSSSAASMSSGATWGIAASSAAASAPSNPPPAASSVPPPASITAPPITMDLGLGPQMHFKAADPAVIGWDSKKPDKAHITFDRENRRSVDFAITWSTDVYEYDAVYVTYYSQQCVVQSPTTTPPVTSQTHSITLNGGMTGAVSWVAGPANMPTLLLSCANPTSSVF